MGRLEGKVLLVTGGAAGIGAAIVRIATGEGAKVVFSDINDADGQRLAVSVSDAVFLHHDVSSEDQWERVIDDTLRRWGRLDVLVNNAGIGAGGPPEEQTLEGWRHLMSINLDGVFLGTKHAIRAMKKNNPQGGSIINMSSIEGLVGDPNLGAYNASKGGVRLYTKSVALYCAKAGLNIRVNSVHPGYIWTPMVHDYLAAIGDVEAGRRNLEALHPVGRIGEPNDIAYGVLYLASDESKFVTGAELVIDGGYTAQ